MSCVAPDDAIFFPYKKKEKQTDILTGVKHFILCPGKETFCTECARM
jgi:hypothetical protein